MLTFFKRKFKLRYIKLQVIKLYSQLVVNNLLTAWVLKFHSQSQPLMTPKLPVIKVESLAQIIGPHSWFTASVAFE